MLNPNKISEIRIILDQLVKDVDSLELSSNVSSVKWEELFISTALLREKLTTLKYDYERITLRDMILKLDPGLNEKPQTEVPLISGDITDKTDKAEKEDIEDKERGSYGGISADNTESSEAPHRKSEPNNEPDDILFDYFEDEETSVADNNKGTPSWMLDNPGPAIDDIHRAITLNDKIYYTRELFKGDEDQYRLTLQRINEMDSLEQAVEYTRRAFSHWDEESPAAYRFYMVLRRRYNG